MTSPAAELRSLVERPGCLLVPGCYDALSARAIEAAGFEAAFMSGFAVSAGRAGVPDTGLLSYAEMVDTGRAVCDATAVPVIGDADTGFGNALNVQRTVRGYAAAGFACVMIEDQVSPKQCGHTPGKQVVGRDEAYMRIRAAVDARDEGADILVMARTDARATHDLDEAIVRANAFREIGADITFIEAPRTVDEMRRVCADVDGPSMANLVEGGDTPLLTPDELTRVGYALAIRPLTTQLAALGAMRQALDGWQRGHEPEGGASFLELQELVGFPEYFAAESRYAVEE